MASEYPPGTRRNIVFDYPLDFKRQSFAVPGTKRPGQTAHYRNKEYNQAYGDLLDLNTPNSFKTLMDVFDNGFAISRDFKFLGHRPKLSSNPDKCAVGSALTTLFESGQIGGGDFKAVGTWSPNRPEWQVIDLAVHAYGLVGVSLYDTLGKDSVEFIINHANLSVVFATTQHIASLLKLGPAVPPLKLIVSIDDLAPEFKSSLSTWGETLGIKIMELHELEAAGRANPIPPIPAHPEQIVTLCYTSGTTNRPKGAVLTHGMLATAAQSMLYGYELPMRPIFMSYLPLSHIYERMMEICAMALGGAVGYFTGDPLRLLEDAQLLKPHMFPSVPRVLNRLYQAAMAAGSVPGLKGALFKKAIQVKLDRLHTTGIHTHAIWDKLVFRKIAAVLGGNVKLIGSGSAPISAEVLDFLKISLGGEISEGIYGMTENCAVCCRTLPGDPTASGTVGPPHPAVEIKLVDVPELGYFADDKPNPRGELCVRGAVCFREYYKDEANTKGTVDSEGWLHTGDVGEVDQCGRMKVIDRVKNIMKLAQGEYVALEKVTNLYSANPIVLQIYVHGDSLQSYLVAVVVPDPVQLSNIYSEISGIKNNPNDQDRLLQAVRDPRVTERILAMLTAEAKKNELKGFETIQHIHLTLEQFSTENGTMTPTMKLKRGDAYNKYKKEIDALYALGGPKL